MGSITAVLGLLFLVCSIEGQSITAADLHTVTGKLKVSIQAPADAEDVAVIEALRKLSFVLQDYLTSKFTDVKSIQVTKITKE
ncbi:hypothetical protein GJAV_G00069120 [Gymnothorax javanicus]|nr:hypothetical protein GJAV_G00069120 [Gymnothorax javanicus]